MPDQNPVLHLFCGKIAAGKSTLARQLADQPGSIVISEDCWLSVLYPEISSIEDYIACSARLRAVMGDHVRDLLRQGLTVVLDFPANTKGIRQWMRSICEAAAVSGHLHFLDTVDSLCKARLEQRNREGNHEFCPSGSEFDTLGKFFVPPSPDEGFTISVYQQIT